MASLILSLNWKLTLAAFKRSAWQGVGIVLGWLYGLGFALGAFGLLLASRFMGAELRDHVTILCLSVVTIGWVLLTLLFFGVDQTLDPGRFALFPIPARKLLPGLFLATLLSPSGIATTLAGLGLIAAYTTAVAPTLAAIVALVLGLIICIAGSRVVTAGFASALRGRKSRDFAVVGIFVLTMVVSQAPQFFTQIKNTQDFNRLLAVSGNVLSWTPFGWPWSIPADVANGRWLIALLRLILSISLAALLLFGWLRSLDRGMTSPLESGSGGTKVKADNWMDRIFPATATGAIAARSLRYWRRDPRHLISVVSMAIFPAIFVVVFFRNVKSYDGVVMSYIPLMMGFLFATVVSQEMAYDGTALWIHITSGISGRQDRLGRVLAALVVILPILTVTTVIGFFLSKHWELLPAVLGALLCLLGTGMGAGSFVGAVWNVAVPPPSSNPFGRAKGGGAVAWLNLLGNSGLTFLPALPVLILSIVAIWVVWLGWIAFALGLIIGGLGLWLGISYGGKHLDQHWPEALKQVTYEG